MKKQNVVIILSLSLFISIGAQAQKIHYGF